MELTWKGAVIIGVAIILASGASIAYLISPFANQSDDWEDSLHVSQRGESEIEGPIIDFKEMSEDQQQIFSAAVADGTESIPSSVDESVWIDNRGVRYQDETYSVAVAVP